MKNVQDGNGVKDTQIDVNFYTNLKRIIAQIVPPSVCNMIVSFYAAIAALHQDQLKTNFKWWWIELFSQQPTLKKQKYKIGLLMINLWVETLATLTNYSKPYIHFQENVIYISFWQQKYSFGNILGERQKASGGK